MRLNNFVFVFLMSISFFKDLSTSLPLLLPPLLTSLLAGVLIEVSPWFGSVTVLVALAVCNAGRSILTARTVTVKVSIFLWILRSYSLSI